jgi:heptosyltransferase-1
LSTRPGGDGAPPRLLIVKLSSLGDVVHAMAAVQDIRKVRPDVQIDWVVERGFAPLVQRCAGVVRIIPCDLRRWRRKPLAAVTRSEWRRFRADLQLEAYDWVLDLQGLTKSAWIAWLARRTPTGLHVSLGNRTDGSSFEAPARWLADRAVVLPTHVHAVQRSRLLCAAALGYAVAGPAVFGLQARGLHCLPQAKPLVVLVHGTSRRDKEWSRDHWRTLGQRLNAAGYRVALAHGSAAEKETSEAIAAGVDDALVWPTMTLDVLVDAMGASAGVIGVDSGLSHIAVALDLPHVQLYNFDTAWRTGPQGGRQVAVYATPEPSVDAVWQAWLAVEA